MLLQNLSFVKRREDRMAYTQRVKQLTLLAMCLGLFMPQLDTNVVNLALPSLQRSLHVDVGALQWIIDSYNLMFASLFVTGGTLSDLLGRKRLFLSGIVLFTLASLLCGLAPTFPLLMIGRMLQRA
jgi:DHA2 family methylenomycin A resistance protein-like MFS transporter